jgi:hypothetical protein
MRKHETAMGRVGSTSAYTAAKLFGNVGEAIPLDLHDQSEVVRF